MYNAVMKLVIQIPCFNEEASIAGVIGAIPKKIDGIDEIVVLVVDDNSTDKTNEIAKKAGANVVKLNQKKGLVCVFMAGVEWSLKNNADILVNLDGDNQYSAKDIEKLISPILADDADMTIGARPIFEIKTFSRFKKAMQKFGSFMVEVLTNTKIKDASSGFRAFNREVLLNLNIFNNFTYTIESIIQAKSKGFRIENVDIRVNEQNGRKSRLFKNNFDYILKQATNLIRFFIIYRPAKFFNVLACVLLVLGFLIGARFLYYYFTFDGSGHIQSLILCSIVLILSFICFMLAIVGDLFSINRKILEEIQYETRCNKYKKNSL